MADYPEPLTPDSLPMPAGRANNFWYVRNESDAVFIFVHGIFSDSRGCWLHADASGRRVFWPDLVRTDSRLGDPSIYMAGFHTAVDAGDFSIAQCAREVLDALQRPDVQGADPVMAKPALLFICHSTGGIVLRYLLERNRNLFREKRVGLALIASPSLGSVWANVAALAARYYNQRLGLQLRWGGEALEDIHGRFKDLVDRRDEFIPGLLGAEACENKMIFRRSIPRWIRWALPPRLKVVTTLSAGQYFGEVRVLPNTDHFSTVKPDALDHPSHEFLVTFAIRFRETSASPQQRLEEASASPQRRLERLKGAVEKLENREGPPSSQPDHYYFYVSIDKVSKLETDYYTDAAERRSRHETGAPSIGTTSRMTAEFRARCESVSDTGSYDGSERVLDLASVRFDHDFRGWAKAEIKLALAGRQQRILILEGVVGDVRVKFACSEEGFIDYDPVLKELAMNSTNHWFLSGGHAYLFQTHFLVLSFDPGTKQLAGSPLYLALPSGVLTN